MTTFSTYGRRPTETERALVARANALLATWTEEHGARRSSAVRCAHSLTGRRHPPEPWKPGALCLPPCWDHAEMWNLPGRLRVLTYHPYQRPDAEALDFFDAWWGTRTVVLPRGESWYYPDSTWRVEAWPP